MMEKMTRLGFRVSTDLWFGGKAGFIFYFILSKIVVEGASSLPAAGS